MKDCLPRGLACEQRLRGRATASVGRGDAADRSFVQFVSVLVRVAVSKARLAEDRVAGIGGTP